ncbi:3-dehydroquinate synthase [Aequorivita lipolytica]|uniref:3-dehydroquinate synthase n=1 Tax=Aequorivita lipolytica TaxID=153267 RepID=A0A5C6YMB3_9FLAO|nr:3-dehydroquinate synthase [Aequorivita lipolytica]TXD68399.1 3-dehydroquinate synthase [Aequorivita lipolytica]SRX51458.1 3-dehydroquinate synthase [Aequorivita lipolytica]
MENILEEKGLVYNNGMAWEVFSKHLDQQGNTKVFVIIDENTQKHCLPYFHKNYPSENGFETITISAGEKFKNIETCLNVWNTLSEKGADRNSLIINLGGGVVTDLGGFVASTFKRGLQFINIPTSLLAMVDASVGGKNGVDLGHIKNQIGVINLPEMVILDTKFLETLPQAHIISGLAEMLKHGLIHDKAYWERIKTADFSNKIEFEKLIWDSVEIKKKIVTKDPLEKNLRKTLNYGHTLGHAIESYFLENDNKPTLLHGEAVAIGIVLATHISEESLGFPKETLKDVTQTILHHFPKQTFTQNDIKEVIKLLVFDKKNRNGKVLFVLLEDIGLYKSDCVVNNTLIYSAFEYYKNF